MHEKCAHFGKFAQLGFLCIIFSQFNLATIMDQIRLESGKNMNQGVQIIFIHIDHHKGIGFFAWQA